MQCISITQAFADDDYASEKTSPYSGVISTAGERAWLLLTNHTSIHNKNPRLGGGFFLHLLKTN